MHKVLVLLIIALLPGCFALPNPTPQQVALSAANEAAILLTGRKLAETQTRATARPCPAGTDPVPYSATRSVGGRMEEPVDQQLCVPPEIVSQVRAAVAQAIARQLVGASPQGAGEFDLGHYRRYSGVGNALPPGYWEGRHGQPWYHRPYRGCVHLLTLNSC